MQHSILGTYLSGKLLCFILCRNKKVILPRDNVNWRAKIYFHPPFPLTSFQPSCTLLFCKNKILVGLVRYFQAYLPPTLLPWKPSQKRVGAGGVGAIWAAFQTYSVRTHLLKKIQVLLGVAEIFPNVKEAENLLLAGADPVLVFPCVRDAIQKDPIGFPHCFLAHCNAAPLGVEDPLLPTQAQAYNMESFAWLMLTH